MVRSPIPSAGLVAVGPVVVEFGELLLELPDALLLVPVELQLAEELRVVVRRDRPALGGFASPSADEEPEDPTDDGEQDDDEQPDRLGKATHPGSIEERAVHHRIDVEDRGSDAEDYPEANHGSIVTLR